MLFSKKSSGILGMNARNLSYIQKYNTKANKKFADDKIYTKTFLQSRGIGVAKTYHTIKNYEQLDQLTAKSMPDSFVIKPNRGFGGEGIIVISGKSGGKFQTVSGDLMTWEEIYLHLASILDGKYALSGSRDQAIIEERLEPHEIFKSMLTVGGLPDIRVIVFNQVPVMAMLRVPTKESGGKGNLQLGALGLGIDITTGKLTYGYKNGRFLRRLPNGDPISQVEIPEWDEILLSASKIQQSTGIGYLGVDLVLTTAGIKILEVNARPGLKIQICNKLPLNDRLKRVAEHKVINPEQGVRLANRLFASSLVEDEEQSTVKPVIGLKEPVTIYSEKVETVYAKIDPHAKENFVRSDVELEDGTLDIKMQSKRLRLPFKQSDELGSYDMVISGKYLQDFFIDVTVENEIDMDLIKDINEKMLLSMDKKLADIDKRIAMISYLKPLNLVEVKKAFMKSKNFNPQFLYKEAKPEFFEEMRKELGRIPRNIHHPLMPLYEEKIKELELKLQLIESRDSVRLGDLSEKLFGKVDYNLYKQAVAFIKKTEITEDESKILKVDEVKKRIESFLEEVHLGHWKIQITEGSAANMSVSKKGIIFISGDIEVTENHLHALIAHEIETHVYRTVNSKQQKYQLLQRGTTKYLETEEGLAVFNQNLLGVSMGEKEIWAALRVVGAYMGKKMSFLELFQYLQDTFAISDGAAWKTCLKVKRGLKDTGILSSFTKDTVYFTGLKKVEEFMKTATKEDVELLYSGKLSLESLDVLKNFKLIKPKYISSAIVALFQEEENKE